MYCVNFYVGSNYFWSVLILNLSSDRVHLSGDYIKITVIMFLIELILYNARCKAVSVPYIV